MRMGIYKPGVIVHHIIEIDPVTIEKPEVALNPDNLELLCRECHADIHGLHGGRWAAVNAAKRQRRDESNRYTVGADGKIFAKDPPAPQ